MSMNAAFRLISSRGLELVVAHPELAPAALDFGLPDLPGAPGIPLSAGLAELLNAFPAAQREDVQRELAANLAELGASGAGRPYSDEAAALQALGLLADDLGDPLSIDKAWHGLHFLLTGTADEAPAPLGSIVLGGAPLGEDLGYGPLRYLRPTEVADASSALGRLTHNVLAARYDPASMEQLRIYPGGWDDAENLQWLLEAFDRVKDYFAAAAHEDQGMLLYLT